MTPSRGHFPISLVLLLILPVGCTSTHRSPERVPAEVREALEDEGFAFVPADEVEAFTNDYAEELRPKLKKLGRKISAYHYGSRGQLQRSPFREQEPRTLKYGYLDAPRSGASANETPLELRPPEVIEYFNTKSGLILNTKADSYSGDVGPGLYAAIDPVQSDDYAGNPWFLLEITASPGTTYIEQSALSEVSRKFFDRWLKNVDWESLKNSKDKDKRDQKFQDLGNGRVQVSRQVLFDNPKIRAFLMESIRSLSIDFIAYAWTSHSTLRHCTAKYGVGLNDDIALSFINPDFLKRGGALRVFVGQLEATPTLEKTKAYSSLLDRIELSFWSDHVVRETKDGRTDLAADHVWIEFGPWGSPINHAFFRTYGWNAPLKRKSSWTPYPYSPTEGNRVYAFLNRLNPEKSGKNPLQLDLSLAALERAGIRPDPESANEITLDGPMLFEKAFGKPKLDAVYRSMENDTFGCSAKYPNERLEPWQKLFR